MMRLAPYQSGLWLAEYLNVRCQLCRVSASTPIACASPSNWARRTLSILPTIRTIFDKGLLCPRCHESISWLPAPFHVDIELGVSLPIQATTYYDYPIREAIYAFKHHENMTHLPLLIHMLRQLPRPHGCHSGNSVIIPMPTTPSRLVNRGFDPVTILSIHLAKHWQIPLWHGAVRVDDTVSQQGLSRSERLTNLSDAFMLNERPPVKRLLLFDDVATTGASLQALARAIYGHTPATASHLYHISAYALAHGSQ